MQFQNPWGALALLLIVPLVALYLLKQRHRELTVPSTALWSQVLTQWEASHPWQKWRKNLLFLLQLAAIVLLALALMRPVWRTAGTGQNNIIVLDLSLSMQAVEGGRSRLERAKEGIRGLVAGMRGGEEVSLIVSGEWNEPVLGRTADKEALLRLLEGLEARNGGARLEEAVQMAASLLDSENSEGIHVFTDHILTVQEEKATVHNVAQGAENVAVTGVSHSLDSRDGSLVVLGLLYSFGQAKTVNVELWGDEALLDVRECALPADGPANVLFEGLPATLRRITLAVSEEDALPADNRAHMVVQDAAKYRVLLQTERNVFLEKAILLREDIELYKQSPADELPVGGYSLVIGDGWAGEALPEDQDVWMIAPGSGTEWFGLLESAGGSVRTADAAREEPLLRHVDLTALRVAKARGFAVEDPATSILAYLDETPLIIQREEEGVKRLAFGFDFHESNLPMEKDFPILVQNILSWFLPPKEGQTGQVAADAPAVVALSGEAAYYDVLLPDGGLLSGRTQRQFEETGQLGFYTVTQYAESGAELAESAFAVNPAATGEGELRTADGQVAGEQPSGAGAGAAELWRRWNLWPYIILVALVLMAAEWWVYHRGT